MNSSRLVQVGLLLILVGFAVTIVGALSSASGSASAGGFILIGPIPIIFGGGPDAGILASVAIVISVVMILLYLLTFLSWRRGRREAELEPKSE